LRSKQKGKLPTSRIWKQTPYEHRLIQQLQEIEELKDELDPEEYQLICSDPTSKP